MNYEERLQYYQKRYALYNLTPPSRKLVENNQFRCPCCGEIKDKSSGCLQFKEGKTLNRDFSIQGRLITETKAVDRVGFYICDKCKKDNDNLEDDPIYVWSAIILAVILLLGDLTYCIYVGIRDGDFCFIFHCVALPFLLGMLLLIVYALLLVILRFLLSIFRYKNARAFDVSATTSMDTLSSGNALL